MADLSDGELVAELKSYGENVSLPIKVKNRPILVKKLNHLRVRHKKEDLASKKTNIDLDRRPSSNRNSRGRSIGLSPPTPTSSSRSSSRHTRIAQFNESPSNLEVLSSDDSDVEQDAGPSISSPNVLSISTNSKPRSSLFTDNVLHTIRRRATDMPSPRLRSSRRSEVLELSTETDEGGRTVEDMDTSVASPPRFKLYPDLSRFSSSFHSPRTDNFESSDSDGDMNTDTNRSGSSSSSTQFSYRNHRGGQTSASPSYKVTPSHGSASPLHKSVFQRRYQMNGPGSPYHRVQQYRSRFSEHLPLLLITTVAVFFVGLSVTYVVKHKDFIFSWLSTSSGMGSDNRFLYCKDESNISANWDCFTQDEVKKAMTYIKDIHSELSAKKGAVMCNQAKEGDDVMKVSVLRTSILSHYLHQTTADRIYRCCILHILANPHWDILLYKSDGSEATSIDDVVKLESAIGDMSFLCRLKRSFTQVVYGTIYLCFAIICAMLLYMYIKYYMKEKGKEQREVYAMVEKIIDILQEHHEQYKRDDPEDTPYLAVQHVRDQLLPPSQRRQYQHIWDKAVDFIAANESRIRMETKTIRGDNFDVWYWLQPALHNGKVWQGQAFGENENNSNQVTYCPSPCLKIRSMFDSNVENEDNWEEGVIDAVLEKCRAINSIVHIYVDVDSKEGCVYIKCSSCKAAGQARTALNGWWFDGRLVSVKHLKTDHYHKRWPESRTAITPLKPSTNQMRSLSQPFYRSSLEMT